LDSIDYYNQNAKEYYDSTVDLNMERTLRKFIELLPEGATVLDLGCGSGRDSLYFLEEGFDVTALDASEKLSGLAQIHIGQDVLNMKFEEMDFEEVFDGVWACASLLHVSENEIDNILDKVIMSIKPGGIIYMSFKYGDFSGIKDKRYFKYYNTKELKTLIGRHSEIEVIEIFRTPDYRKDRVDEQWINIFVKKIDQGEQEIYE
jgi:2-polyprenyl-3-methyl-5-hydroxy-6-metoxy-1,4-benzoquinol methylase